jgi:glutamyl-tRNA reductase
MKRKDQNTLDFFHVIGISYRSADVKVREQFSISAEREEAFYEALKAHGFKDIMFISTCNRTEIYFFSENIHPLVNVWLDFTGGDIETLLNAHFHYKGERALQHLIRVGCGLESQIPGDFEIIMQVRKAFRRAKSLNLANGLFERMLNTAVHTSKQVKHQTAFSTGASSVSYATVRYLRDYFAGKTPRILLIGLGEIGRVTLENLLKHYPPNHISVSNRSADKASVFAETYNVDVVPYGEIHSRLDRFSSVVVATGAPEPIIIESDIPDAFNGVMIDLSVPANIHRNVGDKPGITLVDIDKLSEITRATLDSRLEIVPEVEALVGKNIQEFMMWYHKREMLPIINDMIQQLQQSLSSELNLYPVISSDRQSAFIDRISKRYASDLFRRIEEGVKEGRESILLKASAES